MNVLVTGGTGIVGTHLLVALTKKYDSVSAIYRSESSLKTVKDVFSHYEVSENLSRISWVKADIEDVLSLVDAFNNIDIVYHAAAFVSFNPADKNELLRINIEGTANVVNACIDCGVRSLAYVSSTAAIGRNDKVEVVSEELPWAEEGNVSGYSLSKHYAEREVWRGAEEGLDVAIVNPCIVIGPGKWGSSSTTLLDTAYKEIPFYTNGANAFVDARDVADVLIALIDNDIYNSRFLVIGENMPFKDLFDKLADALNKKKPRIESKKWMSELAWRALWFWSKFSRKNPTITKQTAQSAHTKTVYTIDKLKKALPNFEFRPIDEAIANAARAYANSKMS